MWIKFNHTHTFARARKKEAWLEYTNKIYDTLNKDGLNPPMQLKGYVNRAILDGLRDTIGLRIIEEPRDNFIIDESKDIIMHENNVIQQIKMYTNNIPLESRLFELLKRYPDEGYKFFMEKLGISRTHFYRLRNEYEQNKAMTVT